MCTNTDAAIEAENGVCQELPPMSFYCLEVVVVMGGGAAVLVPCAVQSECRSILKCVEICMYTYLVVHIQSAVLEK